MVYISSAAGLMTSALAAFSQPNPGNAYFPSDYAAPNSYNSIQTNSLYSVPTDLPPRGVTSNDWENNRIKHLALDDKPEGALTAATNQLLVPVSRSAIASLSDAALLQIADFTLENMVDDELFDLLAGHLDDEAIKKHWSRDHLLSFVRSSFRLLPSDLKTKFLRSAINNSPIKHAGILFRKLPIIAAAAASRDPATRATLYRIRNIAVVLVSVKIVLLLTKTNASRRRSY